MIILEVAVCAPVRQTYSYSVSSSCFNEETAAADFIGKRVHVPFGSRPVIGYVLAADKDTGEDCRYEIKPIIGVLDADSLFPADLIALFRWVSDYYHYPPGLVIKTALPSGLSASPQKVISLVGNSLDAAGKEIPESISVKPWFVQLLTDGEIRGRLAQKIFTAKQDRKDLNFLESEGVIDIRTELKRDRISSKLESCYQLKDELKRLLSEQDDHVLTAGDNGLPGSLTKAKLKSLLLLDRLGLEFGGSDGVPRKEFISRYPYGAKVIKTLMSDGLVLENKRRIYRNPFGDLLPFYPKPDVLSDEQQAVLEEIETAIDDNMYVPFLLHGVTGSGKTEVYLRAAEQAIQRGKTVLVLVPEIALATQVEAHFISRFQDIVALLHSGLSSGERFDEWWRILNGTAKIVIGARSAIFAPLQDIGLIVVDEEHDASYKQEDRLRYNARDLALVRGKQYDSVVILGSATPSITSYYHSRTNKYRLLQLKRRLGDRDLPEAVLVDLKKAAGAKKKSLPMFHAVLKSALAENLEQGRQSILLLNRRGFSTSVICKDCGTFVECNHCKVTMNLHKMKKLLLCHYCGFQAAVTTACQHCGSCDLHPVGFGTERVEEELNALLPDARIARLDSDIAADRKRFLSILKAMQDKEIDVLIGTQIIAKGLHFPGVTLVGIIMADSGLGFPDFRAAEKTYQLITQVTGRAGRGDSPGKVFIQTMQPDHYAVALAAGQYYPELVETELSIRSGLGFPPYSRLVLIIIENLNNQHAKQSGMELYAGIQRWCRQYDPKRVVTMLGPAPAPLEKLRDSYRWQILLKSGRLPELHGVTDWVLSGFKTRSGTNIYVDVDPENMM